MLGTVVMRVVLGKCPRFKCNRGNEERDFVKGKEDDAESVVCRGREGTIERELAAIMMTDKKFAHRYIKTGLSHSVALPLNRIG